jgi:hypothetical protein
MATTAFDTDGVRPAHDVSKEFDVEKSINHNAQAVEAEKFQPGVQRVRAITEIWSKQTLIAMFIL